MPNEHTEAVRRNILPRSVTQRLPDAFAEWRFTGHTVDHRAATASCELCEQEQLRYHFQIANAQTRAELWVGSQCILKFGVGVYVDGRRLPQAQARRRLNSLIDQMRHVASLEALETLADTEQNQILRNALRYYEEHEYLTPKYAFVVLWRLSANRIDHNPAFFKVSLKRQRFRDDLAGMPTSHVHTIWPALSVSQRRIAGEAGHIPPPAV